MLELVYDAQHTTQDTASSMLQTCRHFFDQILASPVNLKVHELEKLPPEQHGFIKSFTEFHQQKPVQCVDTMILRRCKQHPDRVAVVSDEQSLTYGELDDLSLRLALHLQRFDIRPDTFVLSCFKKSAWAVIARLAILRAGGAYVSIHADNPPSYFSSILRQTGVQILLTDEPSAANFRSAVPTIITLSHETLDGLSRGSEADIISQHHVDNACLLLFTSGSTGTPKGVVHTHRSYASCVENYAQRLGLDQDTRFFHWDEYAFDISNIEFLTPLIVGGCCIVPGNIDINNADDLAREFRHKQANTTFLTPTVAIRLEPEQVPTLRNLCVGGESLSRELVEKWAHSPTRLICQYGSSEVAVCCALNTSLKPLAGSTIGRPPTGSVWITDPSTVDKLMPVGACGEIVIEGPHLARGYLDAASPNLAFPNHVPQWLKEIHPDRAPAARLYRSGDLGRMNCNGTFTYLGRQNNILKLNGIRINALEIEHIARELLSPRESIVVDVLCHPSRYHDPQLTALLYVECSTPIQNPASLTRSESIRFALAAEHPLAKSRARDIEARLAQTKPPYMVPTLFLKMEWVPKTASKKLDRRRIRDSAQSWYNAFAQSS